MSIMMMGTRSIWIFWVFCLTFSPISPMDSCHKHHHGELIECRLRTLNPEIDFDNLTLSHGIEPETIHRLKLRCNEVLLFESVLEAGQLALPIVQELSIEQCRFRYLPGSVFSEMRNLRKLSIRTVGDDFSEISRWNIELSRETFAGLSQLQSLSLGGSLAHFRSDVLCSLTGLEQLNLSGNALTELSLREFKNCGPNLRNIDLSDNRINGLYGQLEMRKLEILSLSSNSLVEVEAGIFSQLDELKILNLSSNYLLQLPHPLPSALRSLDLRNNSLISANISNLEQLQSLDLSLNKIQSVSFGSLLRLVILDLSSNQLEFISPTFFTELRQLQVLDLSHNSLVSIPPNTFLPLSNLHSLNLSKNKLKHLTPNTFDGLFVLHKLNLDYNEIETIDDGAFRNSTSLQDLGLLGNNLREVPRALRLLRFLGTLDLGENHITRLSNESFLGLRDLYGLRLVDNQIEEIPPGLCPTEHSALRVLNAAQNRISKVSLGGCKELRVLRLDSNILQNIPIQLPHLLWLNVSQNQIHTLDYSSLPLTLEWIDASHNKLQSISGSHKRLRVIHMSNNLLANLTPEILPGTLETLGLNNNRLVNVHPSSFTGCPNIRRVELVGNELESLNTLRLLPIPTGRPIPEFLLGGNPFLCDCEMEWMLRVNKIKVVDLDSIICRLPFSKSASLSIKNKKNNKVTTLVERRISLTEMKSQDFLCPYSSHCFASCHCCEFDACDCQMTCPTNCTCYHSDTWSANLVDCSHGEHLFIPPSLPMDSTEVHLDGNSIPMLKPHTFIGRKNLKTLFLNSSQIEGISNKSFNGLNSLENLYLQSNYLVRLNGFEFDHLTRLISLHLQDNLIESIANSTFLPLSSLEILRLDGNRLRVFAIWQLSLNPYLVDLSLGGGNVWSCDCEFLHPFVSWTSENSKKISDWTQLTCSITQDPIQSNQLQLLTEFNNSCVDGIDGRDGIDLTFLPYLLALLIVGVISLLFASLWKLCAQRFAIWKKTTETHGVVGGVGVGEKHYDASTCHSNTTNTTNSSALSSSSADEKEKWPSGYAIPQINNLNGMNYSVPPPVMSAPPVPPPKLSQIMLQNGHQSYASVENLNDHVYSTLDPPHHNHIHNHNMAHHQHQIPVPNGYSYVSPWHIHQLQQHHEQQQQQQQPQRAQTQGGQTYLV